MTSFADMIDYDAQFTELARKGIVFSEADKKKFRDICTDELKQFDGDALVTTNLGASATNWVYMLFSFIQNIFNGFDVNNIGDSFSAATENTGEKSKLHMLNEATMRIHQRFKAEGGSFASAAELVSGQKLVATANESTPEVLEHGIFNTIRKTIQLPADAKSSLNRSAG